MAYHIRSRAHPNKTEDVLARCDVPESDGQRLLARAGGGEIELHCGCRSTLSSPLLVRPGRSGLLHPMKRAGTEHEHSFRCPHGPSGDLSLALGLPNGSIREVDGRPELNLRALFAGPAPEPSGKGGKWQGKRADHLPRIYSLAWFLLTEAGLTSWMPGSKRDPWLALQRATRAIGISGTQDSLENRLLLPITVSGNSSKANWAKLYRVLPRNRRCLGVALFATLLPQTGCTKLADLGVGLGVQHWRLADALAKCAAGRCQHQGGRPVLAVGLLTAKADRSDSRGDPMIHRRVEQLALIPVASNLVATPTPEKWAALERAERNKEPYFVHPEDDAIIAMRCTPRSK